MGRASGEKMERTFGNLRILALPLPIHPEAKSLKSAVKAMKKFNGSRKQFFC
jgi:hypothetical protein